MLLTCKFTGTDNSSIPEIGVEALAGRKRGTIRRASVILPYSAAAHAHGRSVKKGFYQFFVAGCFAIL